MTANAQDCNRTPIMNDDITSIEVKNTFGTCSGAPGQDGSQCRSACITSSNQHGEMVNFLIHGNSKTGMSYPNLTKMIITRQIHIG